MNYAKVETKHLQLTTFEGDDHGCAYSPVTLTWKGKPVPYPISFSIEVVGYEHSAFVVIAPPKDRGYRNGDEDDEALFDDMQDCGIVIMEGGKPRVRRPKEPQ